MSGSDPRATIHLEIDDSGSAPVARLTFARPPVNVMDLATIGDLSRALDAIAAREDVAVCVLASEGDTFSAGVAVRDHLPDKLDDMLESFHALCRRVLELPAVTLALVEGPALGGALELLSCCDFVIASEHATFAQPEIDLACFPPLGAALYPFLFGAARASEIVLLGRRFSAEEMAEIGLVHRVCRPDAVGAEAKRLLDELLRKSPAALRIAKRALALGRLRMLESLGEIETLYREELAATEDMEEGLRAFLEKRAPSWKGR